MATGSFPSDPTCRRAILVLRQHDLDKLLYEPGVSSLLHDEEVYILPFPVRNAGELPATLQNILAAGLARPGSMLVQSPYDLESYEDASCAPQRFALAKQLYFSQFCMHLGAKEVTVEQILLGTRTGRVVIDASLPVPKLPSTQIGGTLENDELEKLRNEMQMHLKFAGGAPDIASAERLLREKNLLTDSGMRPLLEMRRGGANQLLEHKLVLNLSSETKSNLKVVASLKLPAFLKISTEYSRLINEQSEYALTVVVRF